MSVVVISGPAPIVSLFEAKAHLGVTDDSQDMAIQMALSAAQATIDGVRGWTGRAFGLQQLEWQPDLRDTYGPLRLPFPPVKSVDDVQFAMDGGWQSWPSNQYQLYAGLLSPVAGVRWPAWGCASRLRIRFTAGYDGSPSGTGIVPDEARYAVLLMVQQLRSVSQDVGVIQEVVPGVGETRYAVPGAAAALLQVTAERLVSGLRLPRL